MRKIVSIFLIAVACCAGCRCKAQSSLPLHLEMSMDLGTSCKDVMPLGSTIGLSYGVNRLSVLAVGQGDIFVPKSGLTDNYNRAFNLGGGLGYQVLPSYGLEARGYVTRTLGHSDYRNTAYNLGLYWNFGNQHSSFKPIIGMGYSYKDCSAKPNYSGAYLSFGFRF